MADNLKEAHNYAVPASYLLLEKDNSILLMKRKGTNYYNGWYCVPAGHLEEGELPIDALIRETQEEIGISLNKNDCTLVHTMYRTKHNETGDRADYFFMANTWDGEPKICEPHKCDDIQWFSKDLLPDKIMHHVKRAIEKVGQKIVYSELSLGEIEPETLVDK